jgi:hypothetical protein
MPERLANLRFHFDIDRSELSSPSSPNVNDVALRQAPRNGWARSAPYDHTRTQMTPGYLSRFDLGQH